MKKKQKADISLGDTSKEREETVKKMNKIQKLLKHFELSAFAFDPGVRCFVLGDGVKRVDFDGETWEFMEPLLRELLQWRKYGEKFNMFMTAKERRKYETVRKKP